MATGAVTTSPEPFEGRLAREAARSHGAALFAEHGTLIQRICRRLLRDEFEAEDAAQQTFLSAYKALLGGAEPRDGEAWLATIAHNECLQRIRARMRQPLPVHETELEDRGPDVHQLALDNVNAAQLWREINRLPQHQRDAVILREVSGLSYQELGALLGVTRPAVESLLFRARGQLRERLRAALASLNLVGLASEATAVVARLVGSGAAPLAVKTAAVGVGAAVVGGGGVVAERTLRLHPAEAAAAHARAIPAPERRTPAKVVPAVSRRDAVAPRPVVYRRGDVEVREEAPAGEAEAVEIDDRTTRSDGGAGDVGEASGGGEPAVVRDDGGSGSRVMTTTATTSGRDSGASPDMHEGGGGRQRIDGDSGSAASTGVDDGGSGD